MPEGENGPVPSLAGRTVLVTGATGPAIASGVCDAVYQAGAQLVVNGLTAADVDATVQRYPGSVGVVGDVSRTDDASRIITEAAASGQLTGLVNNAGVGLVEPMLDVTDEQFDRLVGVDYRGVWLTSRAFGRAVAAHGERAAIVNVSSVHATATMGRFGVYAAAKAAVEGLTRGFAVDLGPAGVRCNAVAPGYVPPRPDLVPPGGREHDPARVDAHTHTEQVLHRVIEPIDCGWAVAFLLSDQSRCITGQVLTVDAGLTTRLYDQAMCERIYADAQPARAAQAGEQFS